MKLYSFSLLLLFLGYSSPNCAQPLFDFKFSHEIEAEVTAGTLRESSAAYHSTYIGDYRKALQYYELQLDWQLDTMNTEQEKAFKQFHPINAFDELAERTKEESMVIISEAHQKPQHRIFTRRLLKTLYANGFRYLGLETLTPSYGDTTRFLLDTLLNTRGYPLNSPLSGTFTQEPQMSNLVREAIAIGFEVFGYERTGKGKDRDLQQALNIQRFMKARPEGKIILHCGWYHAIESPYPKRRKDHYLAYHLKQLTGIDPLTIYQDALSEKAKISESPFYQLVDANEVSILVNDRGEVFNGVDTAQHFDLLLYHPRTRYLKNRPHWLLDIKENRQVEINISQLKAEQYPIMVEAYRFGDEEHAVPLDRVELKSPEEHTVLVLSDGHYRIVMIDRDRQRMTYELELNSEE